jgi:hypothetical protein
VIKVKFWSNAKNSGWIGDQSEAIAIRSIALPERIPLTKKPALSEVGEIVLMFERRQTARL